MACRPRLGQLKHRLGHNIARPFAHHIRSSASCSTNVSLPVGVERQAATCETPVASASVISKTAHQNHIITAFLSLLETSKDCSAVWGRYRELTELLDANEIPVTIHEKTLRFIIPPSNETRKATINSLTGPKKERNLGSPTEGQIRKILHNMQLGGNEPSLHDYHRALAHYAASGNYVATVKMYKDLVSVSKHTPTAKTFGLCLLTLAHSADLPVKPWHYQNFIRPEVTRLGSDLLKEMAKRPEKITGPNFDLSVRILKRTFDTKGFLLLMKNNYGINLEFPDLPYDVSSDITEFHPLSVNILNTTIDVLGHLGRHALMIQAFEVLTHPLRQSKKAPEAVWEDDEDEDFGAGDFGIGSASQGNAGPHIAPNTTTYNTLIRHVCKSGSRSLGKHYLIQAMKLDRQEHQRLFLDIRHKGFNDKIIAPMFAVNRATVVPVMGVANRGKDRELLSWLQTAVGQMIQAKLRDIAFFAEIFSRAQDGSIPPARPAAPLKFGQYITSNLAQETQLKEELSTEKAQVSESSSAGLFNIDFSAFSFIQPAPASAMEKNPFRADPFTLNLEDISPPLAESKRKPFDITRHLQILRRDIEELVHVHKDIRHHKYTVTDKETERNARRVDRGKDVWVPPAPLRRAEDVILRGKDTRRLFENARRQTKPEGSTARLWSRSNRNSTAKFYQECKNDPKTKI